MARVEAIYNKEDILKMYDVIDNSRDKLLFVLGITTGYRIGDILSLRKRDVLGDIIVINEEKTGKPRFVGVSPELREALDKYLWRIKDDNDFIFPSQKANKHGEYVISPTQAYRRLTMYAKRINLDVNFGCHSLRKTWAYHLYQENQDVRFLMQALNHTTQEMTLKYIGVGKQEIITKTSQLGYGIN